jgi:hypothetical protein
MFVDIDNRAQVLSPVRLGKTPEEDSNRREAFIQNLVHDHPALIPMAEIEPAFSPLIPVCKELPTPAGYLDNLWITPWGGLVLGEAKLVRNPQARREVVAQALDYARAVANWSFDDLEAAVRIALKQPAMTLWSLVHNETDLTEDQFVDAVERRLRTGQFLLLIIGDGIQEGVEALTAYLQLHAGLHVGLALLDLSLWRNIDGGLIVIPRVPMRTVLIERGIVRIDADQARIDPPSISMPAAGVRASKPKPTTSSEAEFFDNLAIRRPELVEPLKAFLSELSDVGIAPEIGRTAKLLFSPTPDTTATAGYIESNGKVWLQGAAAAANRLGLPDAGENYLQAVADIIGGQVRRYEKSAPEVVDAAGKGTDLAVLVAHTERFKNAIASFVVALAG